MQGMEVREQTKRNFGRIEGKELVVTKNEVMSFPQGEAAQFGQGGCCFTISRRDWHQKGLQEGGQA